MVRFKNRYFVVEITPAGHKDNLPVEVRASDLYDSVMEMVQTLHGDFGVAATMAGFIAKYCNEKTRIAVIRSRHGPHKFVASSIPFIKRIGGRRVKVNTLYVGATIKKCFLFIKNYQEKKYDEFCLGLKSEEERDRVRKELLNLDRVLKIT